MVEVRIILVTVYYYGLEYKQKIAICDGPKSKKNLIAYTTHVELYKLFVEYAGKHLVGLYSNMEL
jgi:hypothetical protein